MRKKRVNRSINKGPFCVYVDAQYSIKRGQKQIAKVTDLRRALNPNATPKKRNYRPCTSEDIVLYFRPKSSHNVASILRMKKPPNESPLVKVEPLKMFDTHEEAHNYIQSCSKALGCGQRSKFRSVRQSDTPPSIYLKNRLQETNIEAKKKIEKLKIKKLKDAITRASEEDTEDIYLLARKEFSQNTSISPSDIVEEANVCIDDVQAGSSTEEYGSDRTCRASLTPPPENVPESFAKDDESKNEVQSPMKDIATDEAIYSNDNDNGDENFTQSTPSNLSQAESSNKGHDGNGSCRESPAPPTKKVPESYPNDDDSKAKQSLSPLSGQRITALSPQPATIASQTSGPMTSTPKTTTLPKGKEIKAVPSKRIPDSRGSKLSSGVPNTNNKASAKMNLMSPRKRMSSSPYKRFSAYEKSSVLLKKQKRETLDADEVSKRCVKSLKKEFAKMENRFVTTLDERLKKFSKKRLREDDGNSGTEEDLETNAYTAKSIEPPDDNGKVTINGRMFVRKELMTGITTSVPTKRINAIMRALWSTEELLKMCLREPSTMLTEYRIMTDEEIDTIVDVYKKIDKNKPIKHKQGKNIHENHREWISDFLKNFRASKHPEKKEAYAVRKKNEKNQRKEIVADTRNHNNSTDTMCQEILETMTVTEYNNNVLTNEEPTLKIGLNLTAFAKKYELHEDSLLEIFNEQVCNRNDDNYCRTVNVEYESEILMRTLDIMAASSIPMNRIERESLTKSLSVWDVPHMIGNYICSKYTEKKDYDDGSNQQYLRLRLEPASYIAAYIIVTEAHSKSLGQPMNRSVILYDCMNVSYHGDVVTTDEWLKILQSFEIVQNGVSETENNEPYEFNTESVPLFASTSMLVHTIKELMADDSS